MKDIILFGTGELLSFYEKIVESLEYKVIGYSDNNSNKWETFINGKPVIPPKDLVNYTANIFISATSEKEISDEIKDMKLEKRLIYHKELEDEWIEKNIEKWAYLKKTNIAKNNKRTIFFDLMSGTGWAGTERWSFKLASGLKEAGEEVWLLRKGSHLELKKNIEEMSRRITCSKLEYFETIDEIVKCLVSALPCVVINNFTDYMPVAFSIVKSFFPDMIKMVCIAHGDNKEDFFKIASREKLFDSIICVSSKIKNKYEIIYNISEDKLLYKETPVSIKEGYEKDYNTSTSLRICYPSRLEVKYKRADLLKEIIKKLESEKLEYVFNIAGDGRYREKLEKFIDENSLSAKVKIHGLLTNDEMEEFWENQDIYINVSDSEGTCQAMLEAMSYAVVPIVTDVSGVDDFIENSINGFVSKVGDIDDMINNIKWIYENRDAIKRMGKRAREEIAKRCKLADYVDFFSKNVLNI